MGICLLWHWIFCKGYDIIGMEMNERSVYI